MSYVLPRDRGKYLVGLTIKRAETGRLIVRTISRGNGAASLGIGCWFGRTFNPEGDGINAGDCCPMANPGWRMFSFDAKTFGEKGDGDRKWCVNIVCEITVSIYHAQRYEAV